MMSAQDQTGTGTSGMPGRPDGQLRGAGGGDAHRGPGLWAAVLAFGLLVVMTAGSVKVLRERGGSADDGSSRPFGLVTVVPKHNADGNIEAVAVLGGQRFEGGTVEFRSADAVAIMGHCVLDLRNARVLGEKATIDVVAIMGHVEIIVPADWEIVTGDMFSAGAVRNLARRTQAENPTKVRIDGAVLMGRLDVRR